MEGGNKHINKWKMFITLIHTNTIRNWFFEKTNKIDNLLRRVI